MIKVSGWLPIGSVVEVAGSDVPVFIAGHMQHEVDEDAYWDYSGFAYPLGNIGTGSNMVFNKDAIENVLFIGYQDTDGLRWMDALEASEEEFENVRSTSSGTSRAAD